MLTCPVCDFTATQFKPVGSIETDEGRYKLRICPKCGADEWSRLVVGWVKDNVSFPRRGRILTLSAPLPLRAGLVRLKNISLVDGETADLVDEVFADNSCDLIVIGETWTHDARDLASSIAARAALREKGWFIVKPLDSADEIRMISELSQVGFSPGNRKWQRHQDIAVYEKLPFVAVQKEPVAKPAVTIDKNGAPLIFLSDDPKRIEIAPAPLERDWMNATDSRFPYLCVPMAIANMHGWEFKCPVGFAATWNGGKGKDAVTVTPDADAGQLTGYSNFGYGILTFNAHGHFRTPPGIDLYVTGPVNRPKHGIQALSGIVETDWSDFFFTMNWMFTAPGQTVRFEKDEPFATIFPVPRGLIEEMDPITLNSDQDPETWRLYMAHTLSRKAFAKNRWRRAHPAEKKKWQRDYFSGPTKPVAVEHKTRLKIRPFRSP